MAGAGDLRTIGSGNIGATNVLRTGRKGLAAATLLFDLGKGAVAIAIAEAIAPGSGPYRRPGRVFRAFVSDLAQVQRWQGGRDLAWHRDCALLAAGGGVRAWCGWRWHLPARFSSLGGILAAAAMPVAAWWFGKEQALWVFVVTLVFVLWKHRGNIQRLMAGTEPRIGKSRA